MLADVLGYLRLHSQVDGVTTGRRLTVGYVVTRAVEEQPQAQGDARFQFLFFLLFFEVFNRGLRDGSGGGRSRFTSPFHWRHRLRGLHTATGARVRFDRRNHPIFALWTAAAD
jgi:hypothetical protein